MPADRPRDSDDDDEAPTNFQFKVVVLGNGTVGKTSLCLRCTQEEHSHRYKQTMGVDFYIKQLTLPGGVNVAMQLWDIGGQNLGGKMVSNYIFGCQAALLVYDITSYQSFLDLEDWYSLVQQVAGSARLPYVALLANKADLAHLRAVRPDKHNAFAAEHRMYSYQVSARTGDGTAATMYRIAADLAGVPLSNAEVEQMLGVVHASLGGGVPAYVKAAGGIGSFRAYTPSPHPASVPSKPQSPMPLLAGRRQLPAVCQAVGLWCQSCWPTAGGCQGCCCRRWRVGASSGGSGTGDG